MKLQLSTSQYRLLSRYCEDLSKALALYNVGGYILPSVLPSSIRPSLVEFAGGGFAALTFFVFAIILVKRGEK